MNGTLSAPSHVHCTWIPPAFSAGCWGTRPVRASVQSLPSLTGRGRSDAVVGPGAASVNKTQVVANRARLASWSRDLCSGLGGAHAQPNAQVSLFEILKDLDQNPAFSLVWGRTPYVTGPASEKGHLHKELQLSTTSYSVIMRPAQQAHAKHRAVHPARRCSCMC